MTDDPDIQTAREICASTYEAQTDFLTEDHRMSWARFMRQGAYDDERVFVTALASIKHARENPTDPLASIAQSLAKIATALDSSDDGGRPQGSMLWWLEKIASAHPRQA